MAYGKSTRRRSYRRTRRTLSNRNVYGKTSAKAQARQIASLRNRINKVYKVCRPEIKTIVTGSDTITYTSESISSYYRMYPMTAPQLGTGDKDRIGNSIRVINGVLYLSMEYFNSSVTGYHDTESSGCQYRIIIGQFKSRASSTIIPSIDNLLEYPSNHGPSYTQLAISPLKEGLTNSFCILRDIHGALTLDRNQKIMKIPFKPRMPYVFDDDGKFDNCWACLIVAGLHYDEDFIETVKITVSDKLVFTDA